MSEWDDAVLYNDYEGMKECYAKLQEENQILHGHIEILSKSNKEKRQILKTLYRMLEEWEKTTSHPDATLVNIRNLKHVLIGDKTQKEKTIVTCKFCKSECIEIQDEKDEHLFTIICPNCEKELLCDSAQNTDYVQKEKTQ